MLLIRRCEEQLVRSHRGGLVHGLVDTCVGQEAIAAGVCAHLHQDDVVFSSHRGHGHALAKGVPPEQLLAELYGRETGCSHGRGGSMHLFAPEQGLMGTSGIVGPCILHAAGAGYSFMLEKSQHVSVTFFGDGAVSNGAFHEGLNLAGVWKLPTLFVCENNGFATEVPFRNATANTNVAQRGAIYGMPGIEVDGNDVEAVFRAAESAVARARFGGGPTLLECRTYRTRPHAEGMGDFTYRAREEVERWKARCPILQLRRTLLDEAIADEVDLVEIEEEVRAQIERAQQAAENGPWPDPASAARHVYAEPAAPPPSVPAPASREITYMQATLEALSVAMARDGRIFVFGEGIEERGGNFNSTAGLYNLYGPERLRDTPICERGFVGVGCGAAMAGARPVIDLMFIDFMLDATGEVLNQIAKMQYISSGRLKMPIVLRACIGVGHSAAMHHSGNYSAILAHLPGLQVDALDAIRRQGLLQRALAGDDPVLFFEHRELLTKKGPVPAEPYEIEFGKAAVVRPGDDATVVAMGLMAWHARAAGEQLAAEGISIELIDPRTISPLDIDTIAQSVRKTGRLLIVDETFAPCGIGAEIAARIADRGFDDLDAPIRRLNGAHVPTPYSPPLETAVVPGPSQIVQAIRDLLAE